MLSYVSLASYEHFLVDRYRGRLVLKLCMTFGINTVFPICMPFMAS